MRRVMYYEVKAPGLGIVQNIHPNLLDDRAWVDGMNVRFRMGGAEKAKGYRKFSTQNLGGPVISMARYVKFDGSQYFIAQTPRQAWIYNYSTSLFQNATPKDAGGVEISFTGVDNQPFSIEIFTDWVIISNGIDPIYRWDGVSSNFVALQCPFKASLIKTFANCLVLASTVESGIKCPQRVRWSALGQPEKWDGEGTGFFDVAQTPDFITALEFFQNYLVIYKERSIYLASYVGPPFYFEVQQRINGIGAISSRAVANLGDRHLFVAQDDIYQFNGVSAEKIGGPIRDEMFSLIDPQRQGMVQAILDTEFSEVIFVIPSTDGKRIVYVYNYREGTWAKRNLPIVSWAEFISSNSPRIDDLSQPIDTYNRPIDSRDALALAPLRLFGGEDGYIYVYGQDDSYDGAPFESMMQTKLFDFGRPDLIKRLLQVEVVAGFQGDYSIQLEVGTSDKPYGLLQWRGPFTIQLGSQSSRIDLDISGRYFSFRFRNSQANQPFSLQGFRFGYILGGNR